MPGPVWDPGLQSERTRLAWTRTAALLSGGGMGAAAIALRGGVTGVAVAAFVLAALCGSVLLARTGARFRKVQRALHAGRPLNTTADAVLAWLGALAVAAGCLVAVVQLA